jgi:S-adenosylmethionine decarboxylase
VKFIDKTRKIYYNERKGIIMQQTSFGTYGKHSIADIWGCNPETIDNLEFMEALCRLAASATGATVVDVMYKDFEPQGLTVIALLEESHLSIHTYPEFGFVAFDCYTCSNACDPREALKIFEKILEPSNIIDQFIERGLNF